MLATTSNTRWDGQEAVKVAAEIMVAGSERAAGDSDANRLGDEEDFLDLKGQYPIVAARVQASSVDLNSDGDTIARLTDDDHASSINVVMSTSRFICSRGNLYSQAASQSGILPCADDRLRDQFRLPGLTTHIRGDCSLLRTNPYPGPNRLCVGELRVQHVQR